MLNDGQLDTGHLLMGTNRYLSSSPGAQRALAGSSPDR